MYLYEVDIRVREYIYLINHMNLAKSVKKDAFRTR